VYFTACGHLFNLPAAEAEDGLGFLDPATLAVHHATFAFFSAIMALTRSRTSCSRPALSAINGEH
jgi:hypothetical protein